MRTASIGCHGKNTTGIRGSNRPTNIWRCITVGFSIHRWSRPTILQSSIRVDVELIYQGGLSYKIEPKAPLEEIGRSGQVHHHIGQANAKAVQLGRSDLSPTYLWQGNTICWKVLALGRSKVVETIFQCQDIWRVRDTKIRRRFATLRLGSYDTSRKVHLFFVKLNRLLCNTIIWQVVLDS